MTTTEMNANRYLGKTATTPRLYAEDLTTVYRDPADLAKHQAWWDAAERHRVENRRRFDERVATIEAEKVAAEEARRTTARAALEDDLRRRFLSNPAATSDDWARHKQALIDQALAEAASTSGATPAMQREYAKYL